MANGNLSGQRALVTGASSGIGAAIAREFGRAGIAVAVNYHRGGDTAREIASQIEDAGGSAFALQGDVSDEAEVRQMFAQVRERFGGIDILINNAGIQKDAPVQDLSLADWQAVISVNLTGQFLCAREAIREFLRQGVDASRSKSAGKIICISSVHDVIPWAGHVNYAASKGGVMLLMRSLAQEVAEYRIRVNSISPGAIRTPINESAWNTREAEEKLLQLIPYGRVGEVDDIAKAALWLASDDSDYVTGETLYIDGGMSLYPAFRDNG
jgi:glucose 1-dehydrogenase